MTSPAASASPRHQINWEAASKQLTLEQQRALAVKHPQSFLAACEQEKLNMLKSADKIMANPYYKKAMCRWIQANNLCRQGDACDFAHSEVEHWAYGSRKANSFERTPLYRTELCTNTEKNHVEDGCMFGHPGKLMRKVTETATGKKTPLPEFYICPSTSADDRSSAKPGASGKTTSVAKNTFSMAESFSHQMHGDIRMAHSTSEARSPLVWHDAAPSPSPASSYNPDRGLQIQQQRAQAAKADRYFSSVGIHSPIPANGYGCSPVPPTGLTPPHTPPLPSPRRPTPATTPPPKSPSPTPPAVAARSTLMSYPLNMLPALQAQLSSQKSQQASSPHPDKFVPMQFSGPGITGQSVLQSPVPSYPHQVVRHEERSGIHGAAGQPTLKRPVYVSHSDVAARSFSVYPGYSSPGAFPASAPVGPLTGRATPIIRSPSVSPMPGYNPPAGVSGLPCACPDCFREELPLSQPPSIHYGYRTVRADSVSPSAASSLSSSASKPDSGASSPSLSELPDARPSEEYLADLKVFYGIH